METPWPSIPTPTSSNASGWYVWFTGLPPNVSARWVFGQFGPEGGVYNSGPGEDGYDGGGGPLTPGVYDLYVQPTPGFIPVPASATYYVSTPEFLNVSVAFVAATPCYQVFTEVGLPQGTDWWVIGAGGLAFFANNSVIDTTGCGGLDGVVIGNSLGYQQVRYPPSAFYPSGATIPVFFAAPSAAPGQFLGVVVAIVGVFVGSVVAVAYVAGQSKPGPAEGKESSSPAATSDDFHKD